MSAAAADIAVRIWGEARGERQHAGVIRVLVAGEHAGAIQLGADGGWTAEAGGPDPPEPTSHATAQEALDAVARSSWARKLGARSASPVYWSGRAVRLAERDPLAGPPPAGGPDDMACYGCRNARDRDVWPHERCAGAPPCSCG